MRHFTHFFIAGFTFYEGTSVFNKLKIGTKLRMQREPGNRYDTISKILEMGHDIFGMVILQINPRANPESQV